MDNLNLNEKDISKLSGKLEIKDLEAIVGGAAVPLSPLGLAVCCIGGSIVNPPSNPPSTIQPPSNPHPPLTPTKA